MIQLYPANQTDFSRHGITLHPSSCLVTYAAASRYDLEAVFPLMENGPLAIELGLLNYGGILWASVPPQHIPEINMGVISYWKIPDTAPDPVPLYKTLGYSERVTYSAWAAGRSYMAGDKVTDGGQNYQCTTGHGGITTPPAQNPNLWTQISNYRYVSGKIIARLPAGTLLTKLADFNATYMRAADTAGRQGFIEIAKCEQVGGEEPYILPARDIKAQPFYITEIRKQSNAGTVSVHAVHDTYKLNGMLLGECSLIGAAPSTALAFVQGAMMETWPGMLATNIQGETITQDYSWKMAGDALLNPRSGLIAQLNARLIRDKRDVILLDNAETPVVYKIAYGVNLVGVNWKGSVDQMVTRVYPRAKAADNTPLMLPEGYVETARAIPFNVMQLLDIDAKVGDTEEQTDGTVITLTEADVYARMRQAAENRFSVDHCDLPIVTLDLDFVRMGDTEEFRQYRALQSVTPYDRVYVVHGPLDISIIIQMIGYTWDSILERYQKTSFGDVRQYSGRNVTDWDLRAGAVTSQALSESLKKRLGV